MGERESEEKGEIMHERVCVCGEREREENATRAKPGISLNAVARSNFKAKNRCL